MGSSMRDSLVMYNILLVLLLVISGTGCSRSPLSNSANYHCGEGDRVISAENLFCVYTTARNSRPLEESAGEEMSAGTQGVSETPESLCPITLPYVHIYDSLYICSAESDLSLELIESVVVLWSAEYFEMPSTDQGVDLGIGIVEDATVTTLEPPIEE